jgi:hypothetical protein
VFPGVYKHLNMGTLTEKMQGVFGCRSNLVEGICQPCDSTVGWQVHRSIHGRIGFAAPSFRFTAVDEPGGQVRFLRPAQIMETPLILSILFLNQFKTIGGNDALARINRSRYGRLTG